MASVIATDGTRCFSINSDISRAMPGHREYHHDYFQSRNSSTSAILSDGTMPTVIFVAWLVRAENAIVAIGQPRSPFRAFLRRRLRERSSVILLTQRPFRSRSIFSIRGM